MFTERTNGAFQLLSEFQITLRKSLFIVTVEVERSDSERYDRTKWSIESICSLVRAYQFPLHLPSLSIFCNRWLIFHSFCYVYGWESSFLKSSEPRSRHITARTKVNPSGKTQHRIEVFVGLKLGRCCSFLS